MSVFELSHEQLVELKQAYIVELDDEGLFGEVIYGMSAIEHPSWSDLADADEIIPDDVVYNHYEGCTFEHGDFSCDYEEE